FAEVKALEREDLLYHRPPLFGLQLQELPELALGNDDGPFEMVIAQSEYVGCVIAYGYPAFVFPFIAVPFLIGYIMKLLCIPSPARFEFVAHAFVFKNEHNSGLV